jgi:hypothetical protein
MKVFLIILLKFKRKICQFPSLATVSADSHIIHLPLYIVSYELYRNHVFTEYACLEY